MSGPSVATFFVSPRAFACGLPFRRLCRLLVTVDGPHLPRLVTATRLNADHSIDGPFIHLPAPICGAVLQVVHACRSFDLGGQRPGSMYGRRRNWLHQLCASTSATCFRPHSPRLCSTMTTHCAAGSTLCVTISRTRMRSSTMHAMHPASQQLTTTVCVSISKTHK